MKADDSIHSADRSELVAQRDLQAEVGSMVLEGGISLEVQGNLAGLEFAESQLVANCLAKRSPFVPELSTATDSLLYLQQVADEDSNRFEANPAEERPLGTGSLAAFDVGSILVATTGAEAPAFDRIDIRWEQPDIAGPSPPQHLSVERLRYWQ